MKTTIKISFLTIILSSLLLVGFAEDKKADTNKKDDKQETRSRALLVKQVDDGKVDGLRIKVWQYKSGSLLAVDPATEFKSGDQIKVSFKGNFDGYVYIVNITPGGKKQILFPLKDNADNRIIKDKVYSLPEGNDVIAFDEEKGVEVLQVYMSRERIKVFDDALKNTNGEVGASASNVATELQAKETNKGGIAEESTAVGGIRARKIILAPSRDKERENVAIPEDEKGKPAKLSSGDGAVFEIRLKHT
jgi:hypothetical protein